MSDELDRMEEQNGLTENEQERKESPAENAGERVWRVNSAYVDLSEENRDRGSSAGGTASQNRPAEPSNGWNEYGYRGQEPEKKKGGFGRKLVGIVAAAATFAVVAGGIIAGAQYFTRNMDTSADSGQNNQNDQANAETPGKPSDAASPEDQKDGQQGGATLTKDDSEIDSTHTVTATLLDVSPVVDEVIPTVVSVTNTTVYTANGNYFNWFGSSSGSEKASGAGSGVIIAENDTELLIVTNAHVVIPEDYTGYTVSSFDMEVTFCDDETVDAYIKGTDEEADLAVIAVNLEDIGKETRDNIKIATIGDSDALKVGNGVIAIGNALGFGQSVTVGYVSALEREVTIDSIKRTLLQTDAAINPGNSGGGLFDVNGRLIGINSAKYSSTQVEGVGYAIPISSAEDIITELMNMETIVRNPVTDEDKMSYLGVETNTQYTNFYDAQGMGAYIVGVTEGGPAEKAGLMAYDIITGLNDKKITTWNELVNELAYYEGGETVTVTYLTMEVSGGHREYVEKTCEITLGFKKDFVEDDSEEK